jgi:hypothetical protein
MHIRGIFLPVTVVLFLSNLLALAQFTVAAAAERCQSGYGWRERFEGFSPTT